MLPLASLAAAAAPAPAPLPLFPLSPTHDTHTDTQPSLLKSTPLPSSQDYAKAGANMYTFHLEAVAKQEEQKSGDGAAASDNAAPSSGVVDPRVRALVDRVRALGMRAGLAIKPATPAESLFPYIDAGLVDMALVMTVEPGFGGQSFMPGAAAKCVALRARSAELDVQVDGGIAPGASVESVAEAGANVLVAGSAVFGAPDPAAAMAALRQAVDVKAGVAAA
jgi:ribulose-phosphate 3-epimerase